MILDAETLLPAGAVDVLVRGAERLDLPGSLKTELHASVVELNTDVCRDVDEAMAALRELRAAAIAVSFASVPDDVMNVFFRFPGAIDASFSARFDSGSLA